MKHLIALLLLISTTHGLGEPGTTGQFTARWFVR